MGRVSSLCSSHERHGLIQTCELLLRRTLSEELDLENLNRELTGVTGAGRQGGATTGAGDGADGEGTFCQREPPETARPRPGGSDVMTVRQASGEGTTTGQIKSLGGGYGVVLDSLFLLPFVHELGPRPEEVEAGARMARRMSIPLFRVFIWCSGSKAPFAVDSAPTPRQDLVIARVRELVDRSLPTFAIPGQRVAFLKLLRGRGVYDTRDGGLSLASFRSVSKNLVASDH